MSSAHVIGPRRSGIVGGAMLNLSEGEALLITDALEALNREGWLVLELAAELEIAMADVELNLEAKHHVNGAALLARVRAWTPGERYELIRAVSSFWIQARGVPPLDRLPDVTRLRLAGLID